MREPLLTPRLAVIAYLAAAGPACVPEISERFGELSINSLYSAAKALETEGLIASELRTGRRGQASRSYYVAPAGEQAIEEFRATIRAALAPDPVPHG